MDSFATFLVQGARARTAAAQSASPATPRFPGQRRLGPGRRAEDPRGSGLTPDLLFLDPPARLAPSPIQALALRRGRL